MISINCIYITCRLEMVVNVVTVTFIVHALEEKKLPVCLSSSSKDSPHCKAASGETLYKKANGQNGEYVMLINTQPFHLNGSHPDKQYFLCF